MDKLAIIVRGVPGSGKTGFIRRTYPDAVIFRPRRYMQNPQTRDRQEVRNAHRNCLDAFTRAVRTGRAPLALDAINLRVAHFSNYVTKAHAWGYEVMIYRLERDLSVAAALNQFRVPREVIASMQQAMEPAPWPETIIHV